MSFRPEYIQLSELESSPLFDLGVRPANTYRRLIQARGNSLLSTVFVKSMDPGATIKVNYYDQTTGRSSGERNDLQTHPLISEGSVTLPYSNRLTVTRIHDAPVAEVIVTGGSVEFGLYATVVSSFASDLDAALVSDGQEYDVNFDKGMPVVTYDPDLNKMFFLRGKGGYIGVTTDVGEPSHTRGSILSVPGSEVTVASFTSPASVQRNLRNILIHTGSVGNYTILLDGATVIGSGSIAPGELNGHFKFDPPYPIPSGSVVDLKFAALADSPASLVRGYLMASDVTV